MPSDTVLHVVALSRVPRARRARLHVGVVVATDDEARTIAIVEAVIAALTCAIQTHMLNLVLMDPRAGALTSQLTPPTGALTSQLTPRVDAVSTFYI